MSAPFDKVNSNVHACGIEICFSGDAVPSTITGWQPFYNSLFDGADFSKFYASLSSIDFSEESASTAAGTSFKHTISWRFPENDSMRAERIALLHTIKYVKIKFTNGRDLVVGRNDFNQNAKPIIKTVSNGRLCGVTIESLSITPAGFTPRIDAFGLPTLVPVTLI